MSKKKRRNGSTKHPNLLDLHLRITPEIFAFIRRERDLWSKQTGAKLSLSATAIRALRIGLDGNESFGHGERAKKSIGEAVDAQQRQQMQQNTVERTE